MIKRLRLSRNMSQKALANCLGVSRSTVASWELGISTPRCDKLIKLSELFGCTIDELIKGNTGKD